MNNPLDFIGQKNAFQKAYTDITNDPKVCAVVADVLAPTFTQVGNTVTISCATPSATIKYSTDGATYSTYSDPITIASDTTFTAYAQKSEMTDSRVVTFAATFIETVATPTATCENNVVTMACTTDGAVIKYSTDGGETYTDYTEAITITETTTYKIKAVKEGMLDSDVLDFTATYVEPQTENE